MITIFNRKEVFTTFNRNEQARVRNILADNKIDYYVKTINRMSSSSIAAGERSHVGTLGQDMGANYSGHWAYKLQNVHFL